MDEYRSNADRYLFAVSKVSALSSMIPFVKDTEIDSSPSGHMILYIRMGRTER